MDSNKLKLAVGFIVYSDSTVKYLPYFLSSLHSQTFSDFKIYCLDNKEVEEINNPNKRIVLERFPQADYQWAGGNLGFAKAYNIMFRKAQEAGAEYFLALNPDIVLEPDAIEKMLAAMDANPGLGSVSPKILKWDFPNNKKTNIIDTCGLKLLPGLRFIDRGQAEVDLGQCDQGDILGPSGAAALYRMSALEAVREGEQYFDELMFMYKEDCDLAYRLHLAGFKSQLVSSSIIYHDRTASGKGKNIWKIALNRFNKSKKVRRWSFLNQQIIYWKYWLLLSARDKLALIKDQVLTLIFMITCEQFLFLSLPELWRLRRQANIYR